jgi:hypothetical protein
MERVKTISCTVLLSSELLSPEESHILSLQLEGKSHLTASEIIALDLPAKNRVEALLQIEFLEEKQLRSLACDFVEHTLYIYEEQSPMYRHPRRCVEAARQYLAGASIERLQEAIKEAIPTVWRLERTAFAGAFTAGMAVLFLDYRDAAMMARMVANYTQRAIHYREWESRESDLELMFGRELGATWQLTCIAETMGSIKSTPA